MRSVFLLLVSVLLGVFASDCFGQELKVVGKTEVIVTGFPVKVEAPEGYALYIWQVSPECEYKQTGGTIEITKADNGTYRVSLESLSIDWEAKQTVNISMSTLLRIRAGDRGNDDEPDDPEESDDDPEDVVPVIPDGYQGVTKITHELAKDRPSDVGQAIAANYAAVVDKVGDFKDARAMEEEIFKLNRALKYDSTWSSEFFVPLGKELGLKFGKEVEKEELAKIYGAIRDGLNLVE